MNPPPPTVTVNIQLHAYRKIPCERNPKTEQLLYIIGDWGGGVGTTTTKMVRRG